MIGVLKNLWQAHRGPKLFLELSVDHVEIGDDHLTLGLNLAWKNEFPDPIEVSDVQIAVFLQGRKKEGVRFYAQGHFVRLPTERVIKKINGIKTFKVPATQSHVEYLRLMSRAVLDIPEGIYPAEVHCSVSGGTYVHVAELPIDNKLKYRTTESWG